MNDFKMESKDKYAAYEDGCRQMFIGQIIRGVIYGELKYYIDEEENNVDPQPSYKTKYYDIDSLDYSIYFKTDNKTIYITWDNAFVCYGLMVKQLELTEATNDYEQKWDVSFNGKWQSFLGQRIVDFKISWSGSMTLKYPQTFEIKTENEKSIFITSSEIKDDADEYYSQMDNLLVITNYELLRRLENIEQKAIEKYNSKKL